MSTKTLLTADELEQMPDDDSTQIELDEGELITMPPAGEEHSDIEAEIVMVLRTFTKKHNLGRIYTGDVGFRLSDDTVRAPDVSFVRRERLDAVRSKSYIKGAPDLAIEIRSPYESFRQLMRKVKQYLAAGAHTVWVFDPDRREVDVFEASGAERTLTAKQVLKAPGLLPGFSIKVAELFE
ncbi:MAG TPA: Uma2 family endonuclease [Bryobacteraceae bacterium]|jgi:Uma2 family endonuclease